MLPTAKDLAEGVLAKKPETELVEALDLATRVTELLTRTDVRERTIKEVILVTDGKVRLRHHPVRNVKVGNMSVLTADEANGLLELTQYQPHTYEFTYQVGFTKDYLPEITSSAIKNLARYQLTGEVTYREEALTDLSVLRQQRDKEISKRPT